MVAETYFALQHHYGVPKNEALQALRRMFAEGEIVPSGSVAQVLVKSGLATAKPGFVDRMIHSTYTQLGGVMVTCEQSAKKLPSVRVLRQQFAAYARCQKRVHVQPQERMFWAMLSKVWVS